MFIYFQVRSRRWSPPPDPNSPPLSGLRKYSGTRSSTSRGASATTRTTTSPSLTTTNRRYRSPTALFFSPSRRIATETREMLRRVARGFGFRCALFRRFLNLRTTMKWNQQRQMASAILSPTEFFPTVNRMGCRRQKNRPRQMEVVADYGFYRLTSKCENIIGI